MYAVKRSFELDDAAEELAYQLVNGEQPDFDALFKPGFCKTDEKRAIMLDAMLHPINYMLKDISPIENETLAMLSLLMRYGRNIEFTGDKKLGPKLTTGSRKVLSSYIRLLFWGHENKIDPQQLIRLAEAFDQCIVAIDILPQLYKMVLEGRRKGVDSVNTFVPLSKTDQRKVVFDVNADGDIHAVNPRKELPHIVIDGQVREEIKAYGS